MLSLSPSPLPATLKIFQIISDLYSNIGKCSTNGTYLTTMLVHKLRSQRPASKRAIDVREISARGGSGFGRTKKQIVGSAMVARGWLHQVAPCKAAPGLIFHAPNSLSDDDYSRARNTKQLVAVSRRIS